MLFYYILLIAFGVSTFCVEVKKIKKYDSLSDYWYDIFQAKQKENPVESTNLVSTKDKWQIDMFLRRFQPEDLQVQVKHRHVIVKGQRKKALDESQFINHFERSYMLPEACREEEVVAVFEDGLLTLRAPKHELPPPAPERNVPIEVRTNQTTNTETTTTEKKEDEPLQTSSATPLNSTETSKDNEVTKDEVNGLDYSLVNS